MGIVEPVARKKRWERWLEAGRDLANSPSSPWGTTAGQAPSPLERPEGAKLEDVLSTSIDPWDPAALDHLNRREIDALLVELRHLQQRIERPVAQIAKVFAEARAWRALGHARQDDFSRTRLQRSGRWLRMTAALGRAFDRFPALDAAFTGQDGAAPIGKTAVVQIGRVATEANVSQWIERARAVSIRQLEKDVQFARKQDRDRESTHGNRDGSDEIALPWQPTPDESKVSEHTPPSGETTGTERADGVGPADPTVDVTIECPPEMVVAFAETLDLHRAVTGREAPIRSFAEALVAEDGAGECGPAEPTEEIEREARLKRALRDPDERRSRPDHPTWMDSLPPEARALRCRREGHLAAPVLRDVADIAADVFRLERAAKEAAERLRREATEQGEGWQADAHGLTDQLVAADKVEAAIQRATARLLAGLQRNRPWGLSDNVTRLRLDNDAAAWATGLVQYAEERLDISRSRAQQLARVAQRLRAFPILQRDWIEGRLATDKVLALLPLLRAASIPSEQQRIWSEHAQAITVRRLEDEVRELRRRTPRLRRSAPPPAPLPDEDWHASLFRAPGRTLGRLTELAAQLCANPGPSSDLLRLVLPYELGTRLMAAIHRACQLAPEGSAEKQTFSAADGSQKSSPWRGRRPPPYWYGLLQLLLDYAHTWDPPAETGQRRPQHARIYERDGYRCSAPGCTGRCHLEAHHLEARAQGGSDEPSNLVTLCTFHHHQGVHGFTTTTEGPAPTKTRFTLGRGRHAVTFRADRFQENRFLEGTKTPSS